MLEYDPKRRILPFNAIQAGFFKRNYDDSTSINHPSSTPSNILLTNSTNNGSANVNSLIQQTNASLTTSNLNSNGSPNLDPSKSKWINAFFQANSLIFLMTIYDKQLSLRSFEKQQQHEFCL